MKKIYVAIVILILSFNVNAQNSLTDNDINFNPASYNSSSILADTNTLVLNLTTSLSNDIQETSRMHFLTYGNINKLGLGIGAKVNSRFKNYYKTTSAEILLAKKLTLKENHNINFGLNFGVLYHDINNAYFTDQVNLQDETILKFNKTIKFISGFGVGYNWKNKLLIGFSMPELVKSETEFYPTIFTNVSYKQEFGPSSKFNAQPTVLFYTTNIVPSTTEFSVKFGFEEYIWAKIGFRTTKSFVIGLGGAYDFIGVGYVANMNSGMYSNVNQAQHNINVIFQFLGKK